MNHIYFPQPFSTSSPLLMTEGDLRDPTVSCSLVVEGEKVCTSEGLLQSLCVLVATYYVFNCCYSKTHKKTLTFIQKYLIDIQSKEKTCLQVVELFRQINLFNRGN